MKKKYCLEKIYKRIFNTKKVKTINLVFTFKDNIKFVKECLKFPFPVKRNFNIICFLKNKINKIENNVYNIDEKINIDKIKFNFVFTDNYSFFLLKKKFSYYLSPRKLLPDKSYCNVSDNLKDIELIKEGYFFFLKTEKNIIHSIVAKTNFSFEKFKANFEYVRKIVIEKFCFKKLFIKNIFISNNNSNSFILKNNYV